MKGKVKRISALLVALLLCSCSRGSTESSSALPAAQESVLENTSSAAEPELPTLSGFKGSTDKTQFKLSWKAFEGADGYVVEMLTEGKTESEFYFIPKDINEYSISGREQGERAEFVIRAYKQNGADKEYIAQSKTVMLTIMQDSCVLSVQSVCQYSKPSLPTGCECTALTSALRYFGFDVTKNEIADKYLEKIPFTEKKTKDKSKDINAEVTLIGADPEEAFPGDPNDENSYGCFSKPIAAAANRFLASQRSELKAKAVDGKKLSYWYKYVNNGTPIVIWATDNLKAPKKTDSWETKDGKTITWLTNEHCYLLVGFDTEKGIVYCCDPLSRKVVPTQYDAKKFEKRYKEIGMHAVLIE